jgi:N-acetylglucosamine-6-phosphate deacetylase
MPMPQTALLAKKILTPESVVSEGVILAEADKIIAIESLGQAHFDEASFRLNGGTVVDCRNYTLVPGFIDLHVHGAGGRDFMETSSQAVLTISRLLAAHGTTSYLATTMTASPVATLNALDNLGQQVGERTGGATILGIHLEGPFINEKRRGAHPAEHLQSPSQSIFDELLKISAGHIKRVTLAPELEGALDLIRHIRAAGAFVSLGHSEATLAETLLAIKAGATGATHTYNGMREFNHREPGILGAIFTEPRLWAEIIADGVHVDPVAIQVLLSCKGFQKTLLVTDAVSATGMPDGTYELAGMPIDLQQGVARTATGQLAGSTLTQEVALKNLMRWCSLPLEEAIYTLTRNPAKAIGVEHRKGALHPGYDADLTALDDDLNVRLTMAAGQIVYQA